MAEDIEEPQLSEDPFAKYGGKAIEKSEDPFAKYGGKSIGTQPKTEQVGGLTAYSDSRQKTTPTEEIKKPSKLTDYTNVPLEMVSKAKATEVSRKPSTQPVKKIATKEKAAAEGTSTNLQLPTTLKGGQFGIVAEPQKEGELQQKLQQREDDKQTAIKNSLLNQGIKPNTQQYLQKERDLNNQLSNDDLVVDKDNSGEPKLFRSQGFGETLAKTIYNSFKAPVDAYDVNKISDPNQFVQKMNEQTEEESSKPSKILGGGAELIGGVVKPISLLALNSLAPGMGTTAMVSEAYYTELANDKRRLYIAGKKEGLSDIDAAKKAMDASTYTAMSSIPMSYIMSGEFQNLHKTVPAVADNTFKNALIKSGKSVLKIAALGGATEVGKIGTELLGGYNETLPNAINRIWDKTGEYGKMDLGFRIIGGIIPAAGYLKAAAKNWLKNVPEELIQLKSEQYGDTGEKIKQSIEDYKNAASNVEGYVPDEHLASFAGKIEKANKLQDDITQKQLDKIGKPEFVQNKIDEEISDIQKQIDAINNEVNTAAKKGVEPKEIDDVTGIEAGIEPKINVEPIKTEIELEKQAPKVQQPTETQKPTNVKIEPAVAEEAPIGNVKPNPEKVKVLGKDVNFYNDYIPSKSEDIEPKAMYTFNADSKEGIPSLLHDIAYANKREVNGVKTENWHASISGDDLLNLYPEKPIEEVTPVAKEEVKPIEVKPIEVKPKEEKTTADTVHDDLLTHLGITEEPKGETKFQLEKSNKVEPKEPILKKKATKSEKLKYSKELEKYRKEKALYDQDIEALKQANQEVSGIFDRAEIEQNQLNDNPINIDTTETKDIPTQKIEVSPTDKRPEATVMSNMVIKMGDWIKGAKVALGMSDTLRTGERKVTELDSNGNKVTKTIRDEGGIGFPFKSLLDLVNGKIEEGKKAMGWAAVGEGAGTSMINAAKKSKKITGKELKEHYYKNLDLTKEQKQRLEDAIKDDKEYGLVTIYKMGEEGIRSNEAFAKEAFRLMDVKLNEEEKLIAFKIAEDRLDKIEWGKDGVKEKYIDKLKAAKTFEELEKILNGDDSDMSLGTKAEIMQKIFLGTEKTTSTEKVNPLSALLKEKGISIESISKTLEEPIMSGIDAGQPMILLAIDPNSKVVKDTNRHANYSYGVEGFPVGLFNETSQMHHLSPEMMDTFVKTATTSVDENVKIKGTKEKARISISHDNKGNYIAELGKGADKVQFTDKKGIFTKADGKFYDSKGKPIKETANLLSLKSKELINEELKNQGYTVSEASKENYNQDISGSNISNLMQKAKAGIINFFENPETTAQQKLVKYINLSFPNVDISLDAKEYKAIEQDFRNKKLLNVNQKTFGVVDSKTGKVYLNPELLNNNTPIHELGHVWNIYAKEYKPEIYNKGLELITDTKNSKYLDFVLNNTKYQKLISDVFGNDALLKNKETGKYDINTEHKSFNDIKEYVADEALAKAIGDKGELFVNEAQKRNWEKFLDTLYAAIKKVVGFGEYTVEQFQNLKLEDFVNSAIKDILGGKEISKISSKDLSDLTKDVTLPKFQLGDQDSKIKDFIEIQRQKGISDKDIQAGLEKASEKIGIDKAKIEELMSTPKVEAKGDLQSQYDGIKSEKAKKKFITKNFGEVSDEQLSDIVKNNTDLQTIKDKIDAIQKSSAGEVLQRKQEGNGSQGGKRGGMEQGEQGAEATTEKNGEENGDGQRVGISHKSLTELADKLGLEQPERGDVLTPEEYSERGKLLIKNGADPIKAAEEFKKDNKVNSDIISVARAHFNELIRDANDARIKFGIDSEEYKKSIKEANDWAKNVVKPMGTAFGEIGRSLQGQVDLDTGNFVSVSMAVQEKTGKDLSTEQTKEVERLTTNVSDLNKKIQDLENKLTDTISKGEEAKPKAKEGIKEKSKEIANIIRKGKLSKPDIFSSASPASLVWDAAIEITAKTVEVSGDIAQAIADGLEHIKNSDWYKNSDSDKQKAAQKAFKDFVQNQDIKIKFAEKKDNKFTTEEAKSIWEYAKEEYLDKGSDYREMLNGVSKDLGLNRDQVRTAISQPKGAKEITDEMYRNINKRNSAINEAKQWVEEQGNSKTKNFLKAVPSAFFKLKTFGHGTVGGITHAGTNIFQISKWKSYFPFFAKQFKYAFGDTAKYEMAMEDLKNDPQFTFWQRAGLAVDPKVKYDDYQGNFVDAEGKVNGIKKFFDRLGVAGDRGFNALKVYRLDLAKGFYDRLSNEEKADPNTAKEIAKLVNHSTGTSELDLGRGGVSKFVSTAFFAPKLEASRWQGLIGDPVKAAKTFTNWKESSPAEKAGAKLVARNAGEKIATYVALLAANSALLSLMNSKQKINYTNPLSSDWLKFKTGGGKTLDITGGTLASMKLLGTLIDNTVIGATGTKKELWKKPAEKDYQAIGTQLRYKLSPFASTIADLVETTDAMGRPLPYSNVKPKKGETKYTVGSYLIQQQTPIPISAGIREAIGSMKERGMTNVQIQDALMGALYFTVEGFTGAKLGNEPKKKK